MQILDSASVVDHLPARREWSSRLTAAGDWIPPSATLQLLIVLAFSVEWLAEDLKLVPHQITWTIEGLIAALALRAFLQHFPNRPRTSATDIPAAALLIVGIGSALAHRESLWEIALGVRVLSRFIVLYYALLNLNISENAWRRAIGLCLGLVLVQIPVGMYQFWVLGKTDDQVFGSLRSSGALVVVLSVALAMFAARYIWQRPAKRYLLIIPAMFVLPVVGEAKGFFLLAPFPIFLIFVRGLHTSPRRACVVAGVFMVSLTVAIASYGAVDGNANPLRMGARIVAVFRFATAPPAPASVEVPQLATIPPAPASVDVVRGAPFERRPPVAWDPAVNNPLEVTIAGSTWPRLEAISRAFRSVTAHVGTAVVGFGLGSLTFSREEVEAAGGGILYVAPVARRVYETGLLGLALYWALLAATAVAGRAAQRSPDPFWRAIAFAFPGVAILYAISEAYTETLMDAPGLMFWLFAAAVANHASSCSSAGEGIGTVQGGGSGKAVA